MRRKKNPDSEFNLEVWNERDKLILESEGFDVEEKSKYHFRVKSPNHNIAVEVWPSSKKIMQLGAYQTENYDDDILNSVAEIFENGV